MGTGKNILLSIISFVLIILISIVVVLASMNMLLYPSIYENALEKSNTYGSLGNIINQNSGTQFIQNKNFQFMANFLIENFLSYARGDSENLNLVIKINQTTLNDFLQKDIEKLPPCISGQDAFNGNIPLCKPANETSSQFSSEVLAKNNATIPKETSVDLTSTLNLKKEDMQKAKGYISMYKSSMYLLSFLTFVFIILIFLLSDRKFHSTSKIVGISFFFAGISTIIFGFSSSPILNNLMSSLGSGAELDLAKGVVQNVMGSVLQNVNLYGYVITFLGATLFGLSFLIKKVEDKS